FAHILHTLCNTHGTRLACVLTTVDLVSLGVGSCVGTGMYVVAGLVAKEMAGPGVILSFVIAAVASILSGVCYAEFGVRVPKTTGSAYTYSYVTVGEFVAFFIGWNLILEYLIGTAAGASALSRVSASRHVSYIFPKCVFHVSCSQTGKGEESYPDLLALVIAVVVTVIVSLGVKNSLGLNNVLNVINLVVWVFIMIAGLFFVDITNWDYGRFLPYGWSGVMQGAATCFYAFIGFDIIATTGEETKSPDTSIPYAITASLVTSALSYSLVSVILTLLVPYNDIDGDAPLMEMFAVHGFQAAKFVVAVGAIAGLTASLLGSLFPMPRVIYAMAGDGLLFRFLGYVSPHTETPVVACIVSGSLAALLALLVSLQDLIEMMSIGTLLAYTLVSVCVLLLRYQPEEEHSGSPINTCGAKNLPSGADGEMLYGTAGEASVFEAGDSDGACISGLKRLLGPRYYTLRMRLGLPGKAERPTPATGRTVTTCVLLLFILAFVMFSAEHAMAGSSWAGIPVLVMAVAATGLVLAILRQPENPRKLPYMAPCVPFVPASAMLVNIYLMLKLSRITWIRFAVWCFAGLLTYFGYGMWNSSLEVRARQEEATASSYQHYNADVDDSFAVDHSSLYPQDDGTQYQGWAAPQECGYQTNSQQHQHQYQYQHPGGREVQYEENYKSYAS
uniref:Solute carrier family 7 member 14b n=1 Tax=Scleropages formosus TaxID=113540 RepID=A0A8C9VCX2_SCLFO